MKVNAYVVTTEQGLILVDGMLTVSDAESVRAACVRRSLLHPFQRLIPHYAE